MALTLRPASYSFMVSWVILRTSSAMPAAVVAEDVLDRTTPHHLAHGALGDLLQHRDRILHVEQIVRRIVDLIENGELDVHDVLVARQHQAGIVTAGRTTDGHLAFDRRHRLDGLQRRTA